jgi:hypothetical protein
MYVNNTVMVLILQHYLYYLLVYNKFQVTNGKRKVCQSNARFRWLNQTNGVSANFQVASDRSISDSLDFSNSTTFKVK